MALVVLSALLFGLLEAVAWMEREAERSRVREVVARLELGLKAEAGSRIARGQEAAVHALAGTNPVRWLAQPPGGYRGEYAGDAPASLQRGYWYYDRRAGALMYVPILSDAGSERLGFLVVVEGGLPRMRPTGATGWLE